jgi:hypothetical protein
MFRKLALISLAAASVAAFAPSAASAHGMGGGHGGGHWGGGHGHWGFGGGHYHNHFYRSSFFIGGSCYKTVFTEFGPRRVNVCDVY